MKVKMKSFVLLFCLITLPACLSNHLFSQTNSTELSSKKEQLEKSIAYTNYLLNQTRTEHSATLHELELLQARINSRKQLIDQHRIAQSLLIDTIARTFILIDSLESQLSTFKNSYQNILQSIYRTRNSYQKALFILASENINQAWRRMSYFSHYSEMVKHQIKKISTTESLLYREIARLESKVERNQQIINTIFEEYTLLEDDLALKDSIANQLTNQIDQLTEELNQNRATAQAIEKQISEIVDSGRDDMLQAGVNIIGMDIPETTENYLLSAGFEENKGRLPWPVEKGVVSALFGEHDHPKLENLRIKNNGINILTHREARVQAVFGGVVTRIMALPNFNNVVILRHGDFLSVYSNLSTIEVATGDFVAVQKTIGTVYTDNTNGKTELHFEIWNGKNQLNPVEWLLDLQHNILSGKAK
jgi:murein hydrolase activator